jgi:hypothetical protein
MNSLFKINTGEKKKLIKYWIVKNDPPNPPNPTNLPNLPNKTNPLNIQDKISISGTIGLIIFKHTETNKNVYVWLDDHSNNEYCDSESNKGNKIFVNDLYKYFEKYKNPIFLLEEPFILEDEKLLSLWDGSKHLEGLQDFHSDSIDKCGIQSICNSIPVDIRLSLFDVSIEELVSHILDKDYYNEISYYTPFYFKNLLYLFGIIKEKDYIELLILNDSLEEESNIDPEKNSNVRFLRKIFDLFSHTDYYKKLYEKVYKFYINYVLPNSNVLIYDFMINNLDIDYTFDEGFPFTSRIYKGMLDEFDHIINGIMEFYIVILINNLKNEFVIVNTGLYHALNIKFILEKYYNYKIEYEVGITKLEQIIKNVKYINCIQVDNKFL